MRLLQRNNNNIKYNVNLKTSFSRQSSSRFEKTRKKKIKTMMMEMRERKNLHNTFSSLFEFVLNIFCFTDWPSHKASVCESCFLLTCCCCCSSVSLLSVRPFFSLIDKRFDVLIVGVAASNRRPGSLPLSRYFSTSSRSRSRYSTYKVSCSNSFLSSTIFSLCLVKLNFTSSIQAFDKSEPGNFSCYTPRERWKEKKEKY